MLVGKCVFDSIEDILLVPWRTDSFTGEIGSMIRAYRLYSMMKAGVCESYSVTLLKPPLQQIIPKKSLGFHVVVWAI